jgi:hypothetical protein
LKRPKGRGIKPDVSQSNFTLTRYALEKGIMNNSENLLKAKNSIPLAVIMLNNYVDGLLNPMFLKCSKIKKKSRLIFFENNLGMN